MVDYAVVGPRSVTMVTDSMSGTAAVGERYEVRARLGMGGMGVVYEAYDRQRAMKVALKSLRQLDATALFRFKKEFRALCDIAHPNLVELYDLFGDNDDWFFTMELVVGTTFLKHVRPDRMAENPRPERASRGRATVPMPLATSPETSTTLPGENTRVAMFDEQRLRQALRQLAEGVCALHSSGKLHRDLKPSNVLVAEDGRVVICDFGLVRSMRSGDEHTSDDRLSGTPAYMSPEQAANEPLTEASDWYAVGVMLYEALTGRRPHLANTVDALRARRSAPVLAPHLLIDDVPADLEKLCLELLQTKPEERPSGSDVLTRLGGEDGAASVSAGLQASPFIGRERELQALHAAAARAVDRPSVAFVTGSSGLGKSALIRHFIDALDDQAIVLQGRCYERESVPYKALDSLVDSLSTILMGMPSEWLETRLPPDIMALARLFPVLKRVDLVAAPAQRTIGTPDPQETRRRAFRAMRSLLDALAEDRRLVLFLDDVHWGDADSAALLAEILRPPNASPLLVLLAHRDEEAATSPFLRVFGTEIDRPGTGCDVTRLSVGPLTNDDARALATALLTSRRQGDHAVAASIVGEARGNPFFVQELVHHAARSAVGSAVVLDDVLADRLGDLPGDALTLLRVLGVAGKPTEFVVAAAAAGLETRATAALAALRSQRLVRIRGGVQQMMVEPYHDRVREVIASRLPADAVRTIHAQLARALEMNGRTDPELLLEYRRGAGHLDEALRHAITAARNATEVLAFDRAAVLYRVALDLYRETRTDKQAASAREEERRLEIRLGEALSNAGRGADAAAVFLAAAKGASVSESLELERRAAEQLIFSGRIAEGVEVIRGVLPGVDLELPETSRGALLSLLARRVRLRLRGMRHRPRDASELSPAVLHKVDLCWSFAVGLGLNDNIRGTDFQTRHLLLALASGEPYRISRALSMEVAYSAASGAMKRAERLRRLSRELAEKVEHPHAMGLANATYGVAAFLAGRWREAIALLAEAEEIFRDHCTDVTWEKNTVVLFSLLSLFQLGELGELRARLPRLLHEAEERGNYYADVVLRVSRTNVAWLVPDDVAEALRQADHAIARWPQDRFVLPHYYDLIARTSIDLYRGDPETALARLEERVPLMHAAYIDRIQRPRIETRIAHAGAATAVAALKTGSERRRLLAKATKLARSVLGENAPWAAGLARMTLGRIAEVRGEDARALEELDTAIEALDAFEMALYANVARRQRGELIGGDEGRKAVQVSNEGMAAHGITRPDRFAFFLSPGRERETL